MSVGKVMTVGLVVVLIATTAIGGLQYFGVIASVETPVQKQTK